MRNVQVVIGEPSDRRFFKNQGPNHDRALSMPARSLKLWRQDPSLTAIALFKVICSFRFERLMVQPSIMTGRISPGPDHQDKFINVLRMDETNGSLGVATQRSYAQYPAGTLLDLHALILTAEQVKLFVTHRTDERRFFHSSFRP
jgi:hypothetical protein